jgi:hypothetical protein
MKRNLFLSSFIALAFLSLFFWKSQRGEIDSFAQKASLFAEQGKVTDSIVKLMGLTGIRIEGDPIQAETSWPAPLIYLKSRKLDDVVAAVQGKRDPRISWLGNPKKERWEDDNTKPALSPAQTQDIIKISLESLRLAPRIDPETSAHNSLGILFLGATLSRVRDRLAYLNDQYRLRKLALTLPVYILTGERPLDEKVGETAASLTNSDNKIIPFRKDWVSSGKPVTDEGEMIKLVFSQSRHEDLEMSNVFYVYSPRGKERRATTESTIIQWLKEFHPKAGRYVAISNQPYIFYQESVIRRVLLQAARPDIQVDVIGSEIEPKDKSTDLDTEQAKNLLNNISRILYELLEIKKICK